MSDSHLKDDFDLLGRFVDAARGLPGPSGVGNAQISVNAGGVGVWLAVTCCAAMLAGLLVGAVFVATALSDMRETDRELREADAVIQAYINAGLVPQQEPSP